MKDTAKELIKKLESDFETIEKEQLAQEGGGWKYYKIAICYDIMDLIRCELNTRTTNGEEIQKYKHLNNFDHPLYEVYERWMDVEDDFAIIIDNIVEDIKACYV